MGDGDPATQPPAPSPAVAPVRVLVVDDEEDAFVIVRALLRQRGAGFFEFTWAATAAEGVRLLVASQADIAFVDYRLPDGDGLEVVAAARAAGSRTPIVLLTGHARDGLEVDALHAGAIDYVDKSALSARGLERVVRLSIERSRIAEFLRHSLGLHTAVVDAIADGVIVTDHRSDPVLRHLPTVAVFTTANDPDFVRRAYAGGANAFLGKPVTHEGLADAMRVLAEYWFGVASLPPRGPART